MKNLPDIKDYQYYQDFWQSNYEKINELSSRFENNIYKFEKDFINLITLFKDLNDQLDLLISIYAHYNSIDGQDYLLKLKALLNEYQQQYNSQKTEFNTIYFLINKINELKEECTQKFPAISTDSFDQPEMPENKPESVNFNLNESNAKYKWLSYDRNESSFVVRYDKINYLNPEVLNKIQYKENKLFLIKEGKLIPIMDYFYRSEINSLPQQIIMVEYQGSTILLAIDSLGKKVLSSSNKLEENLQAITLGNNYFLGTLRLFGKKHYLLRNQISI